MANESISIVVNSPPSTEITFTPNGELTAPVAVGTVIGSISIQPTAWVGALVLSGDDEADFSLSTVSNGVAELINSVQLNARSYSLTLTSAP